jgi:IMP dehydrogenase/GMP reductase
MINSKFVGEGLTYEDVLLVPSYSTILLQMSLSKQDSVKI